LYEQIPRGTQLQHRFLVPGVASLTYLESGGVVTKQAPLFLHSDHLGSVDTVTSDDDAGAGVKAVIKERRSYDAFGLKRNPTWLNNSYTGVQSALVSEGYTGHNDDSELGLIDMKGRIYDPTLSKFLTPDPLVANPAGTQDWNPYAYVVNNPLTHTDPTGFAYDQYCNGCNDFLAASEAFWSDGSGGLISYGRGQLDREATWFAETHTAKWLKQSAEGPIQGTKKAQVDDFLKGGVQVASASIPGLISSTLTDEDVDAICKVEKCAAEVTIVAGAGVLTDYDKMWCKGKCSAEDYQAGRRVWSELGDSIEKLTFATIGAYGVGPLAAASESLVIGGVATKLPGWAASGATAGWLNSVSQARKMMHGAPYQPRQAAAAVLSGSLGQIFGKALMGQGAIFSWVSGDKLGNNLSRFALAQGPFAAYGAAMSRVSAWIAGTNPTQEGERSTWENRISIAKALGINVGSAYKPELAPGGSLNIGVEGIFKPIQGLIMNEVYPGTAAK
jgi:RHS repeat-associated protein